MANLKKQLAALVAKLDKINEKLLKTEKRHEDSSTNLVKAKEELRKLREATLGKQLTQAVKDTLATVSSKSKKQLKLLKELRRRYRDSKITLSVLAKLKAAFKADIYNYYPDSEWSDFPLLRSMRKFNDLIERRKKGEISINMKSFSPLPITGTKPFFLNENYHQLNYCR